MKNKTLTQQELESHLWGAADILRGAIDASDYKHYIFGLLFYKRLSDVWEEEYEERLAEFEDEELAKDPEEHRFHIPEGSFWTDLKKKSTNIGEFLNGSFRAIEDSNNRLKGVFQDVDFNNKERFPDSTLELLIRHFDKFSLRKSEVSSDMLGNAYEYLIAKFADDAGAKGGEFYTPKEVVKVLVECLSPTEGSSIYDPTCGSAGMLLEAIHYLERENKNAKSLRLYGQERNLNTWAISKMNLFLHDIDDAFIERGDTLRAPKHFDDEKNKKILKFDYVLANPPFSLKKWGHEFWKKGDPYSRDMYACPPKSYGDYAFVQHMIASLKSKGKLAVVLPHGVLFRGGTEQTIREGMVSNDILECVIGLPEKLFYGAEIPACILIINKEKPKERKGKVLYINSVLRFSKGVNQNKLSEENVRDIVNAYNEFKEIKRFSKIINSETIGANKFNLNIKKYLDVSPPLENYSAEGILKGFIPVEEIENEYVQEKLEGLKLADVLVEVDGGYSFKEGITGIGHIRSIFEEINDDAIILFKQWLSKYVLSLSELEKGISDSELELKDLLKGLGYDF